MSLNTAASTPVPDAQLDKLFQALWGDLEKQISSIPKVGAPSKHKRPEGEILEELVSSIRGIETRLRETSEESPRIRRRRSRMHPMMILDIMHTVDPAERNALPLLIAASLVKDDLPWIYELGLEAYREALHRKSKAAQHRFYSAIRSLRHGPLLEMMGDKETYMLIRELEHMMEKFGFDDTTQDQILEKRSPS